MAETALAIAVAAVVMVAGFTLYDSISKSVAQRGMEQQLRTFLDAIWTYRPGALQGADLWEGPDRILDAGLLVAKYGRPTPGVDRVALQNNVRLGARLADATTDAEFALPTQRGVIVTLGDEEHPITAMNQCVGLSTLHLPRLRAVQIREMPTALTSATVVVAPATPEPVVFREPFGILPAGIQALRNIGPATVDEACTAATSGRGALLVYGFVISRSVVRVHSPAP